MNRIALTLVCLALGARASAALPWETEPPLAEVARSADIQGTLNASDPSANGMSGAMSPNTLSNPQVRASLWGPSNRITLSLLKTDVWDRRYGIAPTVTLAQVREGAFAPKNAGFDDAPPGRRRPVRGFINMDGIREDRYLCWNAYPFPCEKPVGQVILGMDELAAIPETGFVQNCADGVVRMTLKNDHAKAEVELLLPMTRNVIAVRAQVTGVGSPWIRLFRHVDQSFLRYMTADKKAFRATAPGGASGAIPATPGPTNLPFDYAKDAAWNGPVDPPESGTDGKYFWIHQRFPAEKTFPKGFDYVLMGLVSGPNAPKIETQDGVHGLGTLPTAESGSRMEDGYKAIRAAAGSGATASLIPDASGRVGAFITIVTCNEAADEFAEARRKLDQAAADGFDKIAAENAAWFARFYARREEGRIFTGSGKTASESVAQDFRSWFISHGGGNTPDMGRFEATASYANVEQDWQLWHSLPCYNELFYTPIVVRNRSQPLALWWNLVEAWRPAAEANAREVYGAEGGAVVHGYLPPVKPDVYVHTNVALEYCIDTMAQMVRPLWDQWDYSGDEVFLKNRTYPAMRDLALFYASYAQLGDDGKYHFIPSIEAEAWGIFPKFARGRDTISALCMARWTFERAAAAAEILGVDADLRQKWLHIATRLAPYPVYETKEGPIFNSVDGTVPSHQQGDHPFYIGHYPTLLADEINLDSPPAEREMMIRTALAIRTSQSAEVLMLLGASKRMTGGGGRSGGFRQSGPAPESLLNSRSGRMHLFPDVAPGAVVAFHEFQARGGFLVSAARDKNGVNFLEITARRSARCELMNPWPGSAVSIRNDADGSEVSATVEHTNGECLTFEAKAGGRYSLKPAATSPPQA